MDEQELLRRLREAFKVESAERLASLSTRLMELEKTENAEQGQEILEVIYREAHSLKGAARAVNLTEIETISQSMEGVFGAMKRREITPSSTVFDTMHEV
ncbi:MAG: Hpt domain-containing protein, partial [Desulfobulbaceae bacterium]|nr:Hpt domain-containing protein [Desulfobulbaceae bacterium]